MFNAPYIIYKCETCARETERQLDARRPDPVRCTITLNCRGKMARVGERAIKKFLFPSTSSSAIDYRPRGGAVNPLTNPFVDEQISLTSANSGVGLTVLALQRRFDVNTEFFSIDVDGDDLLVATGSTDPDALPTSISGNIVLFKLAPELVKYKKYVYLINTTVQSVRGVDDSAEKNVLRFTTEENLKVYINGIELQTSEYDSTSIQDEVIFTPMLLTTNNLVEIIVFDDISVSISDANTVRLPLKWLAPNDTIRGNFCWGDVGIARVEGVDKIPLFCTDVTALVPGNSYGFVGIELLSEAGDMTLIDPEESVILLGKQPFAFIDKDLYAYATIEVLVDDRVLSYKNSSTTGAPELTVSESDIYQSFEPITIENYIVSTESVATNVPEGTASLKRKYTLGPT